LSAGLGAADCSWRAFERELGAIEAFATKAASGNVDSDFFRIELYGCSQRNEESALKN
jgi:hypothetical protein